MNPSTDAAHHGHERRYYLLILGSTLLFGSSFPATKAVLSQMSPLWLVAIRFFIAALSILPMLWLHKPLGWALPVRKMPWVQLAIIGLLQTAGSMAFLNIGLQYTSPSMAAILMASNPLVVALLAWVLLKERLRPLAYLGLLIAFCGVSICIGVGALAHGSIGHGELLVICGSLSWAAATLLIRRFALPLNSWVMTFWQMLIGSGLLVVLALVRGEPFSLPHTLNVWLSLAWLALPATTGAMGLWFMSLHMGGAVRTSGFLFLSPFFSAVIAYLFLGDGITANEVSGGVLIALGIYLLSQKQKMIVQPLAE